MDKATHDRTRRYKELFAQRHPVFYVARAIQPAPDGGIPWVLIVPDGTNDLGSRLFAVGRDEADMWRKANLT
jgi:hypothetical protein